MIHQVIIHYPYDAAQQVRKLARELSTQSLIVKLDPWHIDTRGKVIREAAHKQIESFANIFTLTSMSLSQPMLEEYLRILRMAREKPVALTAFGTLEFPQGFPEGAGVDFRKVRKHEFAERARSLHFALRENQAKFPDIEDMLLDLSRTAAVDSARPILGLPGTPLPPPDKPSVQTTLSPEISSLREPDPRYADFTFYEAERHHRLEAGQALQAERDYLLEVAVRAKPRGITAEKERQPVREPKQKEPVTIWVTAEGEGIHINEPVRQLTLPPLEDSTENAEFIVRPLRASTSPSDFARIRIALYYEFNLLEDAVIQAEVVGKFESSAASQQKHDAPVFVRQRSVREYLDFDHIRPRSMNIRVEKHNDQFKFNFVLRNKTGRELPFAAFVRVKDTDLEDLLAKIREIWSEIALSEIFTTRLEGEKDEFQAALRRLAQEGRNLWRTLFLTQVESSLGLIGQWLEEHPLEPDGIVQIQIGADASDFVFPWALLYDRELPEKGWEPINPEGFWGVRYQIEQQLQRRSLLLDEAIEVSDQLRIGFMLWDQFRNATEQIKLMRSLVERSQGRLEVSAPPIIDSETCFALLRSDWVDILYFYSHGHSRRKKVGASGGPDAAKAFLARYDKLEEGSPQRESLRLLAESIRSAEVEPDRSFIQLTYGKLYLDKLLELRELASKPLVILNMCESAQVSPMLSESFVHFFLDRGAAGVLGTECPMTVEFAHPFARELLTGILLGEEVGRALLAARRKFLEVKNPLGLAYTLYGPATLCFKPPSLIREALKEE